MGQGHMQQRGVQERNTESLLERFMCDFHYITSSHMSDSSCTRSVTLPIGQNLTSGAASASASSAGQQVGSMAAKSPPDVCGSHNSSRSISSSFSSMRTCGARYVALRYAPPVI